MTHVAWDIETCPRSYKTLSDAHRERHRKESERRMQDGRETPSEETQSKAASLHPMLGWICCILAAAGDLEGGHREPYSWVAGSEDEEAEMLRDFWDDIETLVDHSGQVRWVTCNGKQFDVPFMSARSVRYDISPTDEGIMDTHKYRSESHLDLANVWGAHATAWWTCATTSGWTLRKARSTGRTWPRPSARERLGV